MNPNNVAPIRREPPGWRRQWPLGIVLIGVAIAMILVAVDAFRLGSVLLSASVLLAAFLRMLLPDSVAGMLVVRSRRVDVTILIAMGVGLSILSFWVPPPPR
jgi:uncharacterized integral membrane protein